MAGRLPPTDASEARVLGITEQAYLDSLDGQAITKDAYLIILPKQGPARKGPARMKIVNPDAFLTINQSPEPTAADRLASMRANVIAQGMEVPDLTSTQATTTMGSAQELMDEEEEEGPEEPKSTQADIDYFVRESERS